MSTAAIALLAPPPAEPARGAGEQRGEAPSFERHLDSAETGAPEHVAPTTTRPQPKHDPAHTDGQDGDQPLASAPAPAPADAPEAPSAIDPAVAAELAALAAAGLAIVLPPPVADPLAEAAAPPSAPAPVVGAIGIAIDPAAASAAGLAAEADATLAAGAHAAGALAIAEQRAAGVAARDAAAGEAATAAATVDRANGTGVELLAGAAPVAAVVPEEQQDREQERMAVTQAMDPTADAAAVAAGTSAPPIATVRPRDTRFEQGAAPEALAGGTAVAPAATADARPATTLADQTPALGPVVGERGPGQAKVEATAAPTVPPGESARAANAMDRAVAGQVSRAILSRGADGDRMLVLRLTPPELGTVRIEVIERAGVMTARIHAEDEAVRGALERSLPQLRQDLRANDAPVRDVSLADAWNGFADRHGRNDGSGGRERRQRDDDAPAFTVDGVAPTRALPRRALGLGGMAGAGGVDARA